MKSILHLSIYTFVGFFGAGINFLLLPLLSHHLSPADYGISAILSTYVAFIIPVVGLQASSLIGVEYFHLKDKKEFASLFSSIQLIPILPILFLFTLFIAFYPSIATILELPPHDKWLALSIFPISLLSIYYESALGFQIITKDSRFYAFFNISKVLIEVGLTILFVVWLNMGWKGRVMSWLIVTVLYALISHLYFIRKQLITRVIQWKYVRQGILFGMPLILHAIGKIIVNQSDRIFIAKMVSIDEAGVYSIGYTIGTVILIFATAFANMLSPNIMESLTNPTLTNKLKIVRLSYVGISILILSVFGLMLVTPFLFHFFIDPKYAGGVTYVFWVSVGYLFWGIYMIFVVYVFYYKKSSFLGWLALLNAIVNIGFNWILIPIYGGLGAAYATAISFFVIMVLVIAYSSRLISLPWFDFRRIIGRSKN